MALIDSESRRRLIEAAIAVRQRAYAPYSNFQVGAALLTRGGQIFTGCNVENVSYGLTICAERAAVFSAVSAGQQRFELLAVVSTGGSSPCGACRQVLVEFSPAFPIILVDVDRPGEITETTIQELLPAAFRSFSPQ
jgi:cytidine deaminase